MNIRTMIAAPIAVLLAVLSLAAVRSNTDVARPGMPAPLALHPGLPVSTLPIRQVHPSAADLREAAVQPVSETDGLSSAEGGGPRHHVAVDGQTRVATLGLAMPYYAFAPHGLTVIKD